MWQKNLPGLPFYCKDRYFQPNSNRRNFKINNCPLKCNSKRVVYLSEFKKYKNLHVGKALSKFRMRLNNHKKFINPSKLRNEEHRNYFMDIIDKMIMKVRMAGNL